MTRSLFLAAADALDAAGLPEHAAALLLHGASAADDAVAALLAQRPTNYDALVACKRVLSDRVQLVSDGLSRLSAGADADVTETWDPAAGRP